MSQKFILLVALGVGAFSVFIVASAIHSAGVMSRRGHAEAEIENLACDIDFFREDQGRYPASLEELTLEFERMNLEVFGKKQNRQMHIKSLAEAGIRFHYQSETNGFVIGATGIDSWRAKWDKIEKRYQRGEARNRRFGRDIGAIVTSSNEVSTPP